MTRRLQLLLAVTAWLFATGIAWDLLQLFAWGQMFAGYSENLSIAAAVRETFEGERCPLCKAVDDAKREERRSPELALGRDRPVLIPLAAASVAVERPPASTWRAFADEPSGRLREAPPTPPPRC